MNDINTIEGCQAELKRVREANVRFIKRVAYMREMQQEYFKTRDHETLRKSKAIEKEVDDFLDRCNNVLHFREVEDLQKTFDLEEQ